MSYQESVQSLLDQIMQDSGDDIQTWIEEVAATLMLVRTLADMRTNFRAAKGENAHELRAHTALLHRKALKYLGYLYQRAFLQWGVELPSSKLMTEQE